MELMSKEAVQNRRLRLVVVALLAIVLIAIGSTARSDARSTPEQSLPVIVVAETGVNSLHDLAEQVGRRFEARVGHIYRHTIRGFYARVPADGIDDIKDLDSVAMVSPDR